MDYQKAYQEAKDNGYSDTEIAQHLAGDPAKYKEALANGYSDADIIGHFTGAAPSTDTPAAPEPPSLLDKAKNFATDLVSIEKQPGLPTNPKDALLQLAKGVGEAVTSPLPTGALTMIPNMMSQGANQAGADVARAAIPNVGTGLGRAAGFATAAALDPMTYVGGVSGGPEAKAATTGGAFIGPSSIEQLAEKYGIAMRPGELSGNKAMSLLGRALENQPGAAPIMQAAHMDRLNQLTKLRDTLVADGATPQAIEKVGLQMQDAASAVLKAQQDAQAEAAQSALKQGANQFGASSEPAAVVAKNALERIKAASQTASSAVDKAFDAVNEVMPPNTTTVPENTIGLAKQLQAQLKNTAPSLRNGKIGEIVNDFIPKYEPGITPKGAPLPEAQLTWGQLKANREALTQLINSADNSAAFGVKGGGTVDVATLKRLKGAISADMQAMAEKAGGDAADVYKTANAMHGEFKQAFNNKTIRSLITIADQKPDLFVNTVFRPGQTDGIRKVRSIMGPDAWKPVQDRFTGTLFGLDKDTPFNPASLRQQVAKYGKETLTETYGQKGYSDLLNLANKVEQTGTMPIDNTFARSLIARSPEKVMDFVIKPDNTVNIEKAKALMGGDAWKEAVASWLDHSVLAKNPEGLVNPGQFVKLLDNYGADTIKAAVGPEQFQKLQELGAVTRLIQRAEDISANRSGTAGVTSMTDKLFHPVRTILTTFSSKAMAKIYTEPTATNILIQGLKAMPNTAAALDAAKKLSAIAATAAPIHAASLVNQKLQTR